MYSNIIYQRYKIIQQMLSKMIEESLNSLPSDRSLDQAEAEALYENGRQLFNCENQLAKETALKKHFSASIKKLSEFKSGEELYELMKIFWKEYKRMNIQQPKLNPNRKIKKINLSWSNVDRYGCTILGKGNWPNLGVLDLNNNDIGSEGCSILTKGQWPNLKQINLSWNSIDDKGCNFLIEGDWLNLKVLILDNNNISREGCSVLIKGNWPKIQTVWLSENKIIGTKTSLNSLLRRSFRSLIYCSI